jgi:hypothetical protein
MGSRLTLHRCECSACTELHEKVVAIMKDLRDTAAIYDDFKNPVPPERVAAIYRRVAGSLE